MKTILATFLLLSFASASYAYIPKHKLSRKSKAAVNGFESDYSGLSVRVLDDNPGIIISDLINAEELIVKQQENPGVISIKQINRNMNVLALCEEGGGLGCPDTHK